VVATLDRSAGLPCIFAAPARKGKKVIEPVAVGTRVRVRHHQPALLVRTPLSNAPLHDLQIEGEGEGAQHFVELVLREPMGEMITLVLARNRPRGPIRRNCRHGGIHDRTSLGKFWLATVGIDCLQILG
jgi:hypothetical protein